MHPHINNHATYLIFCSIVCGGMWLGGVHGRLVRFLPHVFLPISDRKCLVRYNDKSLKVGSSNESDGIDHTVVFSHRDGDIYCSITLLGWHRFIFEL